MRASVMYQNRKQLVNHMATAKVLLDLLLMSFIKLL
jgi:hypothetical protein